MFAVPLKVVGDREVRDPPFLGQRTQRLQLIFARLSSRLVDSTV